jgi:stage II sporulation protein D
MNMRKVLLGVALSVLAVAPVAEAASKSSLTIRGRGYGHGVGMSQYGALGFAKRGSGYREILAHYYRGTSLGVLSPKPDVRVLLQGSKKSVAFSGATRVGDRTLDPAKTYRVTRSGVNVLVLRSPTGRKLALYESPMRVEGGPAAPMVLKGLAGNGVRDGAYRGAFEFRTGLFGGVNAINALGLEDYVRGVVARESPSTWPASALQAQAVAARTYAVTTSAGGAQGFDQWPDVRSQVYGGVSAEAASTNAAVTATNGHVVTHAGKPVVTYFFSTSGGKTENVENSFLGSSPKPWLKSVDDPYDDSSPRHKWGPLKLTGGEAGRKLRGLVKGSFRGVKVVARGVSPRIVRAEVLGSRGRTTVTGPVLRKRFGLNDTWAYFRFFSANTKKRKAERPVQEPAPPAATDPSGGATPAPGGPGARAAALDAGPDGRPLLSGRIVPAPRGALLKLQVRSRGAWHTLGMTTVGKGGAYRATLPGRGTYRVVYGTLEGPAVSVETVAATGTPR